MEEFKIPWSRRRFLESGTLLSAGGLLMPSFVSALNNHFSPLSQPGLPGKHPELQILNDRPWNAETPAHLLDEEITSMDRLFVRNNGLVPSDINPATWSLEISGESIVNPQNFSLEQLKSEFKHYSYQLTIECAGNGRSEFDPPAKGNQWTTGAVGAPLWTGVRLKDVLNRAGLRPDTVYIGYQGKDRHLSGDPTKVPISRGVPISKALEDESLIAWAANGKDLPIMHGFPLRLVFGGWPASTSGKWLSKILVRNKVHDGAKMTGQSYRVPCESVAPGSKVSDEEMCIIESMPIKSIISFPKSGAIVKQNQLIEFGGHAWAGDHVVQSIEYSTNFGASWNSAVVNQPVNRLAWQHWKAQVKFPVTGYFEIWARATDHLGNRQPMVIPGWNPRGYLNNACHRIAIRVKS